MTKPKPAHLVASVLQGLGCHQAGHASSHPHHALGQRGGVEALLGCDNNGFIGRVLEAAGRVFRVAGAAGSSQQEPKDPGAEKGMGAGFLGPRCCTPPYPG